ncbi:hypothetical protein C1H46_038125 [Malus baccata]|uniref:Uncharacterized protein n=1 Tax=Malus baccata TaxID=106549 RepID=A0A540KQ43_MALBA|nr:hypothetical protein C1H46_038125 [Malus baccata]
MTVYNLDPIPIMKENVYSEGRWENLWRWAVLRLYAAKVGWRVAWLLVRLQYCWSWCRLDLEVRCFDGLEFGMVN